jgi:hypothetical protein
MQHASTNLQTRAARPDARSAWLGVVAVSLVDVQIALRTREGCQRGQAGR